jgi:hypothetical protein
MNVAGIINPRMSSGFTPSSPYPGPGLVSRDIRPPQRQSADEPLTITTRIVMAFLPCVKRTVGECLCDA